MNFHANSGIDKVTPQLNNFDICFKEDAFLKTKLNVKIGWGNTIFKLI